MEYAVKAVENGGTCVGIRCKDGVVLAVEKIITSKLLKPGANKKIATVDRNVGVVCYRARNMMLLLDTDYGGRFLLVLFLMVDISYQGQETKQQTGDRNIRHPYLSLLLPVDWVAMFKHTHFIRASGLLVLQP